MINCSKKIGILVGVLALGACTTKYAKTDLAYPVSGALYTIVPVGMKDFETKGLIFVTSKVYYDVNGDRTGSEITHEMLLREAAKVGADDVINIKIDQRDTTSTEDIYRRKLFKKKWLFNKRTHFPQETTYTASALAIKYTDSILPHQAAKTLPAQETHDITTDPQAVLPAVKTNPDKLNVTVPKSATKQFNKYSVFSKKKAR